MSQRSYDYLRVDVFTDRPLGGNPLAVFPAADGLDTARMQAIAREMNLSETVFCFPPEPAAARAEPGLAGAEPGVAGAEPGVAAAAPPADVRLRIFTVDREVPLAGHPTVGTVHALLETGVLQPPVGPEGRCGVRCELGAGVMPVSARIGADGRPELVEMTQRRPKFGSPLHARELAARALGLPQADIDVDRQPMRTVDTGIPWLLVPLCDRTAVRQLQPDVAACRELAALAGTDLIHAFTHFVDDAGNSCVHTRHVFFGCVTPGEDPATGSAAGCLGAHLVEAALLDGGPAAIGADAREHRSTVLQGEEIGRPARIDVTVETGGGEVLSVRVGGQSVTVGRGELFVPFDA